MAKSPEPELRLRITVVDPPSGVRFQLQRGAKELEPPVSGARADLRFEFALRVGKRKDGGPNFLGPYTQGPPDGRFVYVNSGTLAGQAASCWTRRAKIPLSSISWALIDRARGRAALLETEIAGTGRDGGPACGTVPLRGGWRLASGA